MPIITELEINGAKVKIEVEAERSLLSVLRDDLELTGTKYGCGEGQCGACTVQLDGRARRSCITTVGEAVGKKVRTIEGLEKEGRLHPIQQAFLDVQAMQCAYCIPGMVMSALSLLERNPNPGVDEIVRYMEGNICRCGTYPRIIAAVQRAARLLRESE